MTCSRRSSGTQGSGNATNGSEQMIGRQRTVLWNFDEILLTWKILRFFHRLIFSSHERSTRFNFRASSRSSFLTTNAFKGYAKTATNDTVIVSTYFHAYFTFDLANTFKAEAESREKRWCCMCKATILLAYAFPCYRR